jgi:hypothetical protein
MFSIYLYKLMLSSARAAEARKAALNAVICYLNEQGEAIEADAVPELKEFKRMSNPLCLSVTHTSC